MYNKSVLNMETLCAAYVGGRGEGWGREGWGREGRGERGEGR